MLDTLAALGEALGVPLAEFFEPHGGPDQSSHRLQLEAQLRELVRGLDDNVLATAVQRVEVLTRAPRR